MDFIVPSLYKILLDCFYFFRVHKLKTKIRGNGIIFTMHQVNDAPRSKFSPNALLTIKPSFLDETVQKIMAEGYEVITLDELPDRIANGSRAKPFALFTLDDGYRDNYQNAYPIFKKYNLPFTIFIASDYSSHKGEIWWIALEEIIAKENSIEHPLKPSIELETKTPSQKQKAFDNLYWHLRDIDQHKQRDIIKNLAKKYNYDLEALVAKLIMSWDELRELNKDPIVTLAAHTKSHYSIAHLTENEAKADIFAGIEKMQTELGEKPTHFAYPYGSKANANDKEFELIKELGFKTAVTTRKGLIYDEHKNHLTALPRVSLNGKFQKIRYVELFLSGIPFFLHNRLSRLNLH